MDRRLAEIQENRRKIIALCRWLQWFFFAAFALYCMGSLAIALFAALLPDGFEYIGPSSFLGLLPVFCNIVAGGLTLLVLGQMFRAVSKERSPFTAKLSLELTLLAVILLTAVLSEAFIAPGTFVGAVAGNSSMVFDYDGAPGELIHIDGKNLLAAISCFALSAIFRYGATLQCETDDLM